tara:strand:+ start:69 stop:719 length:651 start_codon:yes stop_codon:yes gene_type:complete
MTKVLELCCGTKSFGNVFTENGCDVVSIDIEKKFDPTHVIDIMEWDYENSIYSPYDFDIIFASPPCIHYSLLQHAWLNKYKKKNGLYYLFTRRHLKESIEESNNLVQRILDIIQYFQPNNFIIENPQTGRLKEQELMKGIPYCDATYCQYGMPYMKKTRFWNDANLKLKFCDMNCGSYCSIKKAHKLEISKNVSGNKKRSIIPKKLVEDIFKQLHH